MSDFEVFHSHESNSNTELPSDIFEQTNISSEESIKKEKAIKDKLKAEEAESRKEDEEHADEILAKIEALDGTDITNAQDRADAKKKLDELGKDIDALDDNTVRESANKHTIETKYDALASGTTETSIAHDKIDVNFENADTTLTLFSTLNDNLPNWEKVIGGSGDITENNARGRVVKEFATELIKATGETSIRPDNAYIFTRACEALSVLSNHYNVPLKADLFHDDGACNIKAIKAFAQANKEILTDPNIELSDGTNILDIEDSLALIDIEKRIEES